MPRLTKQVIFRLYPKEVDVLEQHAKSVGFSSLYAYGIELLRREVSRIQNKETGHAESKKD